MKNAPLLPVRPSQSIVDRRPIHDGEALAPHVPRRPPLAHDPVTPSSVRCNMSPNVESCVALMSARQVPEMTVPPGDGPVTRRADQRPRQPCADLSAAQVPCRTIRLAWSTSAQDPCAASGLPGNACPDQLPRKVRGPAVAVQDPRKTGGDS
jgi:hypothetical protein